MKRTRMTLLVAALAVTLTVHGSAFTLETVQSAAETQPTEAQTEETSAPETQTTLSATATPQVPGLNYISGTTDPEGFESATSAINKPAVNGKWAGKLGYIIRTGVIKQSAIYSLENAKSNTTSAYPEGVTGNDSNWAWYDIATQYDLTQTTVNQGNHQLIVKGNFENGRKYWFAFDYFTNMFTVWGSSTGFNYYVTQSGNPSATWSSVAPAVKANKWFSYSEKEMTYTGNDGGTITLQTQTYNPGGTAAFFYDNIMVMPYYKINYITDNGTETDQVLFADTAKTQIITTYVPKTDNYPISPTPNQGCIGWSTEQNATEPMTEISLANADINLYPVWQSLDNYLFVDAKAMSAAADTTLTIQLPQFESDPAATYSWTIGNTDAIVTDNKDGTITVTATGKSGEILFTAVSGDQSVIEELPIYLFGGTGWRPGLDLATGTEKAFDFEGFTATEVGYAYNLTGFTLNTDNGNTYVTSNAAWKYLRPNLTNTHFEKERPLLINYNYKGKMTQHLIVMNNQVSWNMGNTTTDTWRVVNFMHKAQNNAANLTDITWIGIGGNSASPWYSFDNVRIIPSYKITYVSLDGKSETSEYILCDAQMNLLQEYTPNTDLLTTAYYAFSADGAPIPANQPIKLKHEDITIYEVEPKTQISNTTSIRTASPTGIRFRTQLSLATVLDESFTEFGFLTTRDRHYKAQFGGSDANFVLTNEKAHNKSYCTLVTKSAEEKASFIADIGDGENAEFYGVVTGVPMVKKYLTEPLHVRAFVVLGDVTYYSPVQTDSIYEAVKRATDADPTLQEETFVQDILFECK